MQATPDTQAQTVTSADNDSVVSPKIILKLPDNGNPTCWRDGSPTQRAGSCYICMICGTTTGCS